jgi:hypothetical protein
MDSRLLDIDPVIGASTILHIDDDKIVAEERQDVEALLDSATRRFNSFDERARYANALNHIGFIPLNIFFEIRHRARGDKQEEQRLMREWLNDRDNRKFRTRPGRV